MAIGDRIYIADKETLDEVRQIVDTTKTVTEDIKTDLSSMESKLSTRQYFTPSEIVNNKLVANRVTMSNNASNTILLSISGSGVLYAAACVVGRDTSNANIINLSVEIDGSKIINIANTSGSIYHQSVLSGYISADSFLHTNNYLLLPGGNVQDNPSSNSNVYLSPATLTGGVATSINSILYLPKPIRFSGSVIIRGSSSLSNTIMHYMYELD